MQLVAAAAARVDPATEQAGTYLVDLLRPVVAKLERLVANPPAGIEAERIADLHFSLALATQTIGAQSGERAPLERAVAAYRAALDMDIFLNLLAACFYLKARMAPPCG